MTYLHLTLDSWPVLSTIKNMDIRTETNGWHTDTSACQNVTRPSPIYAPNSHIYLHPKTIIRNQMFILTKCEDIPVDHLLADKQFAHLAGILCMNNCFHNK